MHCGETDPAGPKALPMGDHEEGTSLKPFRSPGPTPSSLLSCRSMRFLNGVGVLPLLSELTVKLETHKQETR